MTCDHLAKEFANEALAILAEWNRTGVRPRRRESTPLTPAIIASEAIKAMQENA